MEEQLLSDGGFKFLVDDDGELAVGLPVPRPHFPLLALAARALRCLFLLFLLLELLEVGAAHLVERGPVLLAGDGEPALGEDAPAVFPPDSGLLQFPSALEVVAELSLHGNYK